MEARYYILFLVLPFVVDCSPVYEKQRAVSLVYEDRDGNFKSNLAEVEKLLLDPKVKDLKVAVVSIAGKYRRGKSFLLNFFLRYLNSIDAGNMDNWTGSENEELEGFDWKLQSERVTTGILIWSKIFVTEVNNEKIAVVLMDTQGTFDDDHIMIDHTKIFTMVTLLSSFQIYNVMRDIEEDDLQVLAMFAQYAEQFHNKSDAKMGQHLQFLVRDWFNVHEFSYGSTGGEENLRRKLSTVNRKPEFIRVRELLNFSYEHISCYLMPHPGLKIVSDVNTKGKISAMDETFVKYLKEYVPFVFSKENLKSKTYNGRPITVANLVHYIRSYEKIWTSKDENGLMNIFDIQIHATFDLALKEATEMYKTKLSSVYHRCNSLSDLKEFHTIYFEIAMKHFDKINIKGSGDIRKMYATKLEKDITSVYQLLRSNLVQLLEEKKRREEERKKIEEERKRIDEEKKKIEDERIRMEERRRTDESWSTKISESFGQFVGEVVKLPLKVLDTLVTRSKPVLPAKAPTNFHYPAMWFMG